MGEVFVGIFLVAVLVVAGHVGATNSETRVAKSCKDFGAFVVDGKVYVCHLKEPTK